MKKRIVILTDKQTGQNTPFPSVRTLIQSIGKEVIGIGINSLYNALSLHNGAWENSSYKVSYRTIEMDSKTWE